jgi:hypothetical protein
MDLTEEVCTHVDVLIDLTIDIVDCFVCTFFVLVSVTKLEPSEVLKNKNHIKCSSINHIV